MSNDGHVAFGRADDKVMLWTEADGSVRELASNTMDSTGCCDISADGTKVVYSTKAYNVEMIGTHVNATSSVLNLGGSSERASDPAVSADGAYVTYVSNWPSSSKHEVRHPHDDGNPACTPLHHTVCLLPMQW